MATRSKLSFGDFYTLVWNLVPSVWRSADDEYGKSLQIVLYTMAQHMYYYFYSRIVHMDELFDPDLCPEKYLGFLAGMLGWTLQGTDPASWREQIKAVPLLYKIRGTKRGLLLAEKLVGYSVFMSELYRDHIGDIVPKEKIFNNIPASVTTKPWFRKTLLSLEGELLPGIAESDQFDSFNSTGLVRLDNFGNVVRPRILSKTRKLIFTPSSTTVRYNNITGNNSLARYAKLPRINVVLKYESDLDTENTDGSIKDNNFSSALDLLLQFKPFHVLIQNLEVRYDLSEFIFDQTSISSEVFNTQEQFDVAVLMAPGRAENTITYSTEAAVEQTSIAETSPADPLENRGVISGVHETITLGYLPYTKESSLANVAKMSLPVKSFKPVEEITGANYEYAGSSAKWLGAIGDRIFTLDDFSGMAPYNAYDSSYPTPDSSGNIAIVSHVGHGVLKYNIAKFLKDTPLDFKSMLSSQHMDTDFTEQTVVPYKYIYGATATFLNDKMTLTTVPEEDIAIGQHISVFSGGLITTITALFSGVLNEVGSVYTLATTSSYTTMTSAEVPVLIFTPDLSGFVKEASSDYITGLDSSVISAINIDPVPYRSSITTNINSVVETQSITSTMSRPWDLRQITDFINMTSFSWTTLNTFKYLYDNTMLVVLELPAPSVASKYLRYDEPGSTEAGYIEVIPSTAVFILLKPNIDYYFDNVNNIVLNSASISSSLTPSPKDYTFLNQCKLHVLYLSRTTYKNETEDGIPIRGFRYVSRVNKKFSRQFLVNSLPTLTTTNIMPTQIVSVDQKTKQKTILGTKIFKTSSNIYNRSSLKNQSIDNYNVVSRNALNRIDSSKWTVYAQGYTTYYSGDQKITNNWWSNYYGATFDTPQMPYGEIDTSTAAQIKNSSSEQWLAALQVYNPSNPADFLVLRKSDTNRETMWNRSSCKFVSVPFIRGSRNNLQVFRRDTPTFTRAEESTDYGVDTNTPPRLDNYKYILSDGTDISSPYFSPGFYDDNVDTVETNKAAGTKVTVVTPTLERRLGEKATVRVTANAHFSKSQMTLDSVPVSGAIATNQLIVGVGIPENTYIIELVSGTLNQVGSVYNLSNFVGTVGTISVPIQISIGNLGYNLAFPDSDTYYNNPGFSTQQDTFYTAANSIKTSLYAGNIPVNLDPASFPGITENLDKLDILITGIQTVVDIFEADIITNDFILSYSTLWVSWVEANTGDIVTYGYYPSYVTNVFPNILVFLNGILMPYGTAWELGSGILKTIHMLVPIDTADIIEVQYQIVPGQNNQRTFPPVSQIPQVLSSILTTTDISTINLGNRHFIDLPLQTDPATLTNIPCISWYSNITAEYINSGIVPLDYRPWALYSNAVPDMTIKLNGILLNYKRDWDFFLKTDPIMTSSIAFTPEISLALSVGDSIVIDYFSTV